MKKRLLSVFLAFLLLMSTSTAIPARAEQVEPRAITYAYLVTSSSTPLYSSPSITSTILTYLHANDVVF